MKLNIDPEWLLQMAEKEDCGIVSVGGLVTRITMEDQPKVITRPIADPTLPKGIVRFFPDDSAKVYSPYKPDTQHPETIWLYDDLVFYVTEVRRRAIDFGGWWEYSGTVENCSLEDEE